MIIYILIPQDSCAGTPKAFASQQGMDDWIDAHDFARASANWLTDPNGQSWYYTTSKVM